MKTFKTITTFAVLLSAILLSCSKEKNEEIYDPTTSFYETYTGRQGAGVEEPASFLQLKLEDHGSLLSFNSGKALPGSGSWEVEGDKFKGSFRQNPDNVKITLSGTFDEKENKIFGTWGYGENTIGGGSFYVVKEFDKVNLAKASTMALSSMLLQRFL